MSADRCSFRRAGSGLNRSSCRVCEARQPPRPARQLPHLHGEVAHAHFGHQLRQRLVVAQCRHGRLVQLRIRRVAGRRADVDILAAVARQQPHEDLVQPAGRVGRQVLARVKFKLRRASARAVPPRLWTQRGSSTPREWRCRGGSGGAAHAQKSKTRGMPTQPGMRAAGSGHAGMRPRHATRRDSRAGAYKISAHCSFGNSYATAALSAPCRSASIAAALCSARRWPLSVFRFFDQRRLLPVRFATVVSTQSQK